MMPWCLPWRPALVQHIRQSCIECVSKQDWERGTRTYLNLLRISIDLFAWPTPDQLAKDHFIYSLPRHEANDQAESPKQSWQQSRAMQGVENPQQTPRISEIDKKPKQETSVGGWLVEGHPRVPWAKSAFIFVQFSTFHALLLFSLLLSSCSIL